MAEVVQLRIERTIPELEQMERIGLFNRAEIKQIVKQRKAKEYRLQRRQKTKQDYLQLIEYEKSLLTLIQKRREKTQNFNKKNEIDYSIALRISKLFKAAIVRFQKDVKLWLSHIEFCKKMHWNHAISGMFFRLLQVHNKTPALWIIAAKWEMEENSAPDNARGLFQRGLRFHPESKNLWLEYFQMELMYTDQIKKRREALQIQAEDKDEAILQGKIAAVVFNNAIAAIPDVNFVISFLSICHDFDFAKSHEDQVYSILNDKYSNEEETWDALAKRAFKQLQDIDWKQPRNSENKVPNLTEKVFSYYEKAVDIIPSVKMWGLYIQFGLNLIQKMDERNVTQIVLYTLSLMEKAANKDLLSESLYEEWVKLLNSCEKGEESLSVACQLVQKWPTVVSHWLLCICVHIENKSPIKTIMPLFNQSISNVSEKESLPLWQLGIEWLTSAKPEKLKDLFEHGIHMCAEVCIPLKCAYLGYVEKENDLKTCRTLYNRLKNLKPLSVEFFQKMIDIEYSHHKNPPINRMRRIYEEALLEFGAFSIDLWLNYIQLELTHKEGCPTSVGKIYWRAVKSLEEDKTDLFIAKYALISKTEKLHGKDS